MMGYSEEAEDRWENGSVTKLLEIEATDNKEEEEEDRFSAANRWPQDETLALLRIRSDLDFGFRESVSKSPLWDQISRRMSELGYDRSAKKCKEKFENIYKYHKRLKNCSYARPSGKTYRFFDQLEALDHHQDSTEASTSEQVDIAMKTTFLPNPLLSNTQNVPQISMPISVNFASSPITASTSTNYSSGSESEGSRKKKRKWEDLFGEVMKSVLAKQEELHNKFLEAINKCEKERLAREEAWKSQEMTRIKREQELLTKERSISAAKDAAVLSFLQKLLDNRQGSDDPGQMEGNPGQEVSIVCRNSRENTENSSSRWPREEVEALIRVRSNMELNCQAIGSKGPLWEEISLGMKKIGYQRNAKRCKEKWENINKYYRRVKDSNKQRPVDSKTCPYFHLLDALYTMKTKRFNDNSSEGNLKPEELLMHMMNHNSKESQMILQQEEGQLIMSQESSKNDGDEEEDEHVEYERVANDPSSPVNYKMRICNEY